MTIPASCPITGTTLRRSYTTLPEMPQQDCVQGVYSGKFLINFASNRLSPFPAPFLGLIPGIIPQINHSGMSLENLCYDQDLRWEDKIQPGLGRKRSGRPYDLGEKSISWKREQHHGQRPGARKRLSHWRVWKKTTVRNYAEQQQLRLRSRRKPDQAEPDKPEEGVKVVFSVYLFHTWRNWILERL